MNARLASAWALLPDYLGQHVLLSACALLLGLAMGRLPFRPWDYRGAVAWAGQHRGSGVACAAIRGAETCAAFAAAVATQSRAAAIARRRGAWFSMQRL